MKHLSRILLCLLLVCVMSFAQAEPVTLTGEAQGLQSIVKVEVVVDGDELVSVTVTAHDETPGIGTIAVDALPTKIVVAQSVLVDTIANATVTSNAIIEATRAALASGGYSFENEVAAEEAVARTPETLDYDVVIIGAGGAGLAAGTRAAQQGCSVLIVEKMGMVGGNSLKATGGMNAAGTKEQAALGITDSTVETFIEDTMEGGHQINDRALVTMMAENSAAAVDWLTELGAPLPKVAATGGTVHKYLHAPEDGSAIGPYLVEKLGAAAEAAGATVMLNTTATELLMDEGKAVGVLAQDDKHDYTINAKAVIIASGGYGNNFTLMSTYDPSLADAVTTNHSGATGDGIIMAVTVGAAFVDMEQIQLHPTVYQESGMLVTESLRSHGAILVNKEGKRFTNDLSTRDAVSAAELMQPDAFSWIIFDQRIVDEVSATKKYITSGMTTQGDTPYDLGIALGMDEATAKTFEATMATWNAACAAGEDKEFGRNNGMDADLSQMPLYAIRIAPGIHHTMGGLKINTATEVIARTGEVIPGLYAAGETVGGVHGGNRIGGNAVCDFVVFGRIAGESAAAYAGK